MSLLVLDRGILAADSLVLSTYNYSCTSLEQKIATSNDNTVAIGTVGTIHSHLSSIADAFAGLLACQDFLSTEDRLIVELRNLTIKEFGYLHNIIIATRTSAYTVNNAVVKEISIYHPYSRGTGEVVYSTLRSVYPTDSTTDLIKRVARIVDTVNPCVKEISLYGLFPLVVAKVPESVEENSNA